MAEGDPGGAGGQRRRDQRLVRRSIAIGTAVSLLTNALGAIVVIALLLVVLPTPEGTEGRLLLNLAAASIYVGVAAVVGVAGGVTRARRRLAWLREGRPPTSADRDAVVGLPWAITRVELALWLIAAVLFALLNAGASVLLAVEVAITVMFGGLVSGTSSYLLVERANRPVLARAMQGAPLELQRATGVAWRTVLSWGLGTGVPVGGLVLLAALAVPLDIDRGELALAIAVLGVTALVAGLAVMVVLARSISDPLRALRRGLEQVAEGRSGVRVPVTDATEVGVVQAGFNAMAAGLDERDRLHDLFGRHVGADVARRALEEGVTLGGEVREVAALFVDVVGSTALAASTEPTEVVRRLNAFLTAVVEVVDAHDGTVDAFQGDAALAVWGAPASHPDPCGAALAAARELAGRLGAGAGGLDAGIGVSYGPVVAGHIGAPQRLQHTVIGDPVNEAARLVEVAKARDGRVLASGAAVAAAPAAERARWQPAGEVQLRGRAAPTPLWAPRP